MKASELEKKLRKYPDRELYLGVGIHLFEIGGVFHLHPDTETVKSPLLIRSKVQNFIDEVDADALNELFKDGQ